MEDSCSLEFVESIPSEKFILEAYPEAEEQKVRGFQQQLGKNVFHFVVKDQYEKRMIIKNEAEVNNFLAWYNKHYSQNVKFETMGKFEKIQTAHEASKHKESTSFMEMDSHEMYKLKSLKTKRLKVAKRWYELFCGCCASDWEEYDIIITVQGVIGSIKGHLSGFFLFSSQFRFQHGWQDTGDDFGVSLFSCHRQVEFVAANLMDYLSFIYFLRKASLEARKKEFKYEATAFVRKQNSVDFMVDAEEYYKAVAEGIKSAKNQIFMCGWWISPELPLVRPYNNSTHQYRLDELLKERAKDGVMIYVIAFNSPPVIPNDSEYTEEALKALHKNIRVITHPCDIIPGLWSHHEKVVVIDQKIGFMGGLDLCYGRYDSQSHPINSNSQQMYPGIEYNNNRIKDFNDVQNYKMDALPREQPRMPWHDVALRVRGRVVTDLSYHFIEYWNNSYSEIFVVEEGHQGEFLAHGILEMAMDQKKEREKEKEKVKKKKGKNMNNNEEIMKMKSPKITPIEIKSDEIFCEGMEEGTNQQIFNNLSAEKLFQSLKTAHESILVKKEEARKNFNAFSKNITKKMGVDKKNRKQDYLVLSFENLGLMKVVSEREKMQNQSFNDQCQLLRSASQWSIGLEDQFVERSIQNAYLELIENSKSHIYIENQFFVTSCNDETDGGSYLSNQIGLAIYKRIQKAIVQKHKFKITVVMPLLPGMEGEVNENTPMPLRLVMHWQYKSICRGERSLIEKIRKLTPRPEDYIQFYGLRQHGVLQKRPVTELIYVHTKLMIVDDLFVVCGSANINDRSQTGDRDSELCLLFSQGKKVARKVDGKVEEVNEKAHNLRVKLYKEHFGFLSDEECEDALNEKTIETIRARAKANTLTYRELFGCYPDDTALQFHEVEKLKKNPDLQMYSKLSPQIVGGVVEFPLHFLENQELSTFEPNIIHDVVI